MLPQFQVMLLCLLMGGIFDYFTGKVPNALILGTFIFGIVFAPFLGINMIFYLGRIALLSLVMRPVCKRRWLGYGDAKIMSLCLGYLGYSESFTAFEYAVFAALAILVISSIKHKKLVKKISFVPALWLGLLISVI